MTPRKETTIVGKQPAVWVNAPKEYIASGLVTPKKS